MRLLSNNDDGASYHDFSLSKASQRRKRRRKKSTLFDFKVWKNVIILWIAGITLIEVYFFHRATHILDNELERSNYDIFNYADSSTNNNNDNRPPMPRQPPQPKTSLLPKKIIAVFGPESSGTTFLSTALGVAVGAFTKDGGWVHTPAWAFNHTLKGSKRKSFSGQYNPTGRWTYETDIKRRASTSDNEWEIQHISLPWGWECEEDKDIKIVEALVPDECFRYEKDPYLHPKSAEQLWFSTNGRDLDSSSLVDENREVTLEEANLMTMCRSEVKISETNDEFTCGAKCGTGRYNGCALYPERFSVNITSHLEWYLSRGVDIKVVISIRDRSISSRGKLKGHCHLADVGRKEDEVALNLISEVLEKYGSTSGSRRGTLPQDTIEKDRVFTVSYEGMMGMKDAYMYELYHRLGIDSTYLPMFVDGNRKYLVDIPDKKIPKQANSVNLPPKPQRYVEPPPKASLLPKRVITVFGHESSGTKLIASSIATSLGLWPKEGKWRTGEKSAWIYHQYVDGRVSDGELEVQHLSLPMGWHCEKDVQTTPNIVEALVPEDCSRPFEKSAVILARCRDEVQITDGHVIYPKRFFVNITSHIEWYQSRGVEITAILLMRDRSISRMGKFRDHCGIPTTAIEEDELAASIQKEAMTNYGQKSFDGRRTLLSVSYEGVMQLKGAYFFDIYRQLGIESSYLPTFNDGNTKYIQSEASLIQTLPKPRRKKFKRSLFPKKVITVVGPESSGTTFLATALGIAVGIYEVEGISRQATSSDNKWEIQHLSLPWGWLCEEDEDINIVEALVPADCFRYELDPSLESRVAAYVFTNRKKASESNAKPRQEPPKNVNPKQLEGERQTLSLCRREAKISDTNDKYTCGAKCGSGQYDGFALYPQRFSVNITSHIEWYLSRGIDIKVIISLRDRHISSKGKMKSHCHLADVGRKEDEVALHLMSEAIQKFGAGGTIEKNRVITMSYEAMMQLQGSYLFGLYKELEINSTFHPPFKDGNKKYVTAANVANLDKKEFEQQLQKSKPKQPPPPKPNRHKQSILPKKLITVVGSLFLSTVLDTATTAATNDIDWQIQHLTLPQGQRCNGTYTPTIDALLPTSEEGTHYPARYFVNLISHIEYFLSQGVDITVIVVMRDGSISTNEKLRDDCPRLEIVKKEEETKLAIMKEAYLEYGKHGAKVKSGEKERVVLVSYEGLMELKDAYLFDLYHQLGIISNHTPTYYEDDNAKYVADPKVKTAFRGGRDTHRKKAEPLGFLPGTF